MPTGEKSDNKMLLIGSAITTQAEAERKAVIAKANETREEEISAYKDLVITKMFDEIQVKSRLARQKAVADKALVSQRAYRQLLTRRSELTSSVFESVRDKIREYAAGPQYREDLFAQIAGLEEAYDHNHSLLQVRREDLGLAGAIQEILPGCEVQASKSIRLGGFTLRNEPGGVLLDETLDRRLEAQRPWFLEHCGLKTL